MGNCNSPASCSGAGCLSPFCRSAVDGFCVRVDPARVLLAAVRPPSNLLVAEHCARRKAHVDSAEREFDIPAWIVRLFTDPLLMVEMIPLPSPPLQAA